MNLYSNALDSKGLRIHYFYRLMRSHYRGLQVILQLYLLTMLSIRRFARRIANRRQESLAVFQGEAVVALAGSQVSL